MPSAEDVFEALPGYCKYCSNTDGVLQGIFDNHRIRFTQPAALNDPIDCHPLLEVPCKLGEHTRFIVDGVLMPSANEWYHLHLVEPRINEFGILSLTKNPLSFDMWSRYANGHKGFLIELRSGFNEHSAFASTSGAHFYDVVAVTYSDVFSISIGDDKVEDGSPALSAFEERLFYTKLRRWAAEKEYRMVRPLKDLGKPSGGLHIGTYRDSTTVYTGSLPIELINTVTFGAYMARDTKRWIVDRCRGSQVQFLQCMIYQRETDTAGLAPTVKIIPLDDQARFSRVLEMQPQLFLMADESLIPPKEVSLGSLEELPYFSFKTDLLKMTFRRLKSRQTDE